MAFIDSLWNLTDKELLTYERLDKHTSFFLGGRAKYYVEIDSLSKLKNVVNSAIENDLPYTILGNGTNVIFSDKDYLGVVISVKKLNSYIVRGNNVSAFCGLNLNKLIDICKNNNLSGLERLCNIPASIGGAVYMNASAFDRAISDCICSVTTFSDGKLKKYNLDDCKFKYRNSIFKKNKEIIVSADFIFKKRERDFIEKEIKFVKEKRKLTQPLGKTCGCIFTNPKNDSAGRLIDGCSLKGFSFGGIKISEKHANFFVNNNGTFSDFINLKKIVEKKVKRETGIKLRTEVEIK